MDLKNAKWFKSSWSGAAGHCVEAAFLEFGQVGVRDTKNRGGGILVFTGNEWATFVSGVKGSEFDRPKA